jgi:hypothetical protein
VHTNSRSGARDNSSFILEILKCLIKNQLIQIRSRRHIITSQTPFAITLKFASFWERNLLQQVGLEKGTFGYVRFFALASVKPNSSKKSIQPKEIFLCRRAIKKMILVIMIWCFELISIRFKFNSDWKEIPSTFVFVAQLNHGNSS